MKVTGPTAPSVSSGRKPASGAGGFSLPAGGAAPAGAIAASHAAGGVAGVSALMALQGVETATERRRRAMQRGHGLLDRLEAVKLRLLEGGDPAETLSALGRVISEARPDSETPGLEGVLDQIELRAAVELAKAGIRGGRG